MLILKSVLAQKGPSDHKTKLTRHLASKTSRSPFVHVGVKSRIESVGHVACSEAPDGPGWVPARDEGRLNRPCGRLARPDASLLKGQAFDCGEFLVLLEAVMEGDVMSMEVMARDCVEGLALPCTEIEGAAAQLARALI